MLTKQLCTVEAEKLNNVKVDIFICIKCKHLLDIFLKRYSTGYYTEKVVQFSKEDILNIGTIFANTRIFMQFFKKKTLREIYFELKLLNLLRIQRLLSKECEKTKEKRVLLNLISLQMIS